MHEKWSFFVKLIVPSIGSIMKDGEAVRTVGELFVSSAINLKKI
jgi:hypothetical protein